MRSSELDLSSHFSVAVAYARRLHGLQTRKGTQIPYLAHLLSVSALVIGEHGHLEFAVTEPMVVAALLHDAAEDQGGTRAANGREQETTGRKGTGRLHRSLAGTGR